MNNNCFSIRNIIIYGLDNSNIIQIVIRYHAILILS